MTHACPRYLLTTLLGVTFTLTGIAWSAEVAPPVMDESAGLLFHASFDKDRQAESAQGQSLPAIGRYPYENYTADGGVFAPGVFGQALTGGARLGSYDALGNINPARGTVAFHLKQKNRSYGFEPFVLSTVDNYYWLRYLRSEINRNGVMVVSAANEIYRPQALGASHPDRPTTFDADKWHHVAIVWDQTQGMKLYVDGQIVADNWGQGWTWTSQGVDPNSFWLRPSPDVQYDELYVFDRPLSQEQVHALATTNTPPALSELAAIPADQAWRENRLHELSWKDGDSSLLALKLDEEGLGVNAITQVTPLEARAVMGECNLVINGKLGDGWPAMYGYNFNKGNGLHVKVAQPFDYVNIEGYFRGHIYPQWTLVPTESDKPVVTINSADYLSRWQLDQTQPAGWLSFFKGDWEELGEHRDRESATMSRITELGFFKRDQQSLAGLESQRFYLGEASAALGRETLGAQFIGRYFAADRATYALSTKQPATAGGQATPGLRYHHLLIPARDQDWALAGLRLGLLVRSSVNENALRIEMRDPLLPGRRLLAIDYALNGLGDQPRWVEVTLDTPDRVVPAGKPVWVTLVFKADVNVLWQAVGKASFAEVYTTTVKEAVASHIAMDLPLILARFGDLSSPRPWGSLTDPETTLPEFYRLAGEMFLPMTQLYALAPEHPTLKALWLWTHKFTKNEEPVEPKAVMGHADAPRWALLQRELYHTCKGVFEWWIDNRQAPTGEFGDDWNDDTDFVQDFPKYTLAMDSQDKLLNSLRKVADGVYTFKRLTDGINTNPTDPLHAYEEGINVQPVLALAEYSSPQQAERLMESARTIRDRLTAQDVHGRRRFISNNYGATDIRNKAPNDVETFQNGLMAHPAITLAYLTGHAPAKQFVLEYADGWLGYFNDAVAAGEKRIPAATRLDGTITRWDTRVRGFGFSSLFVAANELESNPTREASAQYWTMAHGGNAFRVGDAMAALEMIDYNDFIPQLTYWAKQADLSQPYVDRFGQVARQYYMGFEVTGDEAYAYRALEASLCNVRHLFDGYTLAQPQNDRIWPPDGVATMMLYGEIPHERNQTWPRHHVSYQGLSDFSAWVREKSDTHLKIWIYSYAAEAETGTVRFWRTPAGEYRVRIGAADDAGNLAHASVDETHTLHRFAGVPVTLQPGVVTVLEIDLVQASQDDYWQRSDPAVGRGDVTRPTPSQVAVQVTNLGNTAARQVLVQLLDRQGKELARQTVDELAPPADLKLQPRVVTFDDIPPGAVSVVVNGDKQVVELNPMNNRAGLE